MHAYVFISVYKIYVHVYDRKRCVWERERYHERVRVTQTHACKNIHTSRHISSLSLTPSLNLSLINPFTHSIFLSRTCTYTNRSIWYTGSYVFHFLYLTPCALTSKQMSSFYFVSSPEYIGINFLYESYTQHAQNFSLNPIEVTFFFSSIIPVCDERLQNPAFAVSSTENFPKPSVLCFLFLACQSWQFPKP